VLPTPKRETIENLKMRINLSMGTSFSLDGAVQRIEVPSFLPDCPISCPKVRVNVTVSKLVKEVF
jgi:hypothetical protein